MKKAKTAKEIFREELIKLVDLLPVDWDQIDPENPAPVPPDEPVADETVRGELTREQKVLWSVFKHISDIKGGKRGKINAAIEIVQSMLFFLLNCHFNAYDGSSKASGIRAGYRFVTRRREYKKKRHWWQLF
jgi:hypothetical protein